MSRPKSILIIDDDPIIRVWLKKELNRNFLNTFEASDGASGLALIKNELIDIVLLDINLPDINGIELLREIKNNKPDCEVIVVTGFGSVEVAISALRHGAIDYVEKPVQTNDLSAALGRAQEKLVERNGLSFKNTILIIDDEQYVAKMVQKFLSKEGYETYVAFCGKDGLDIIENNKIDVLVTDVFMNDMTGIDVLKKAKKMYQDIEGIVITGNSNDDMAVNALRSGAIDYLIKPMNLEELLISVQKAIERINLNRTRLYRGRELKLSSEIVSKMNEELERRIEERSKDLTQTQVQLFQTSKLATLGEMSAGLAHEMNQPLGGISLVAQTFRKLMDRNRLTNEEISSGLNDIEESIKRMTHTITHIRTFARQDALKFISVDIPETIHSSLNLIGEQLRLHEIEVVVEFDSDLPKITGEPYQLEQVWLNLMSNARDAMKEKEEKAAEGEVNSEKYSKKLHISAVFHKEAGKIEISFEDNGIGLTNDTKEKMLEPFFTTKKVGKGTGLGLSISYGIIESHKGKIEFESEYGKGTTGRILLPLHIEE